MVGPCSAPYPRPTPSFNTCYTTSGVRHHLSPTPAEGEVEEEATVLLLLLLLMLPLMPVAATGGDAAAAVAL